MNKLSIRVIAFIAIAVFFFGCVNSAFSRSRIEAVIDEPSKVSFNLIKEAVDAFRNSNPQPLGELWALALLKWDKNERRLFIQGSEDADVTFRTVSAMSFFIYAGDLSDEEAANLWSQTSICAQARTALIVSVYMSKGHFMREKDRLDPIPSSALVIEKMMMDSQ